MNNQQFIGKVFGHFRILEPAGHGGMGLVFKALNTHLDKIVALKMIAPGLSLNEKLLNRFKTEARALARLENPHIVRISDLLEAEGHWFIVMEFIEGDTLRDRLKSKRPLPLKEAIEITEQILSALQHAHSASIVHRDIKPSNILLTRDNVVKVTDFGLAKIQENSLIHTQVSAVGGTLYYMSPEQVRSLKETDHRTDIYSLGITMYQMVTGTVPFDPNQTDFDIRETIVRKPLPKPSTFNPYLPPEIDVFIMKAIAKNPDDRFQSAVEMHQKLVELKEQIKDKLELAQPARADTDEEINFDGYGFEIKDDFSEESLAPEIPVEANLSHEDEAQQPEALPADLSEHSQLSRITDIVKKKRFWLFSLLPALIIILIIYLLSLPQKPVTEKKEWPSLLSLHTRPNGAKVVIDGQPMGQTPIDSLKITRGTVRLVLKKAGFAPFDSLITFQPGQHLVLAISLNALPPPSPQPEPSTQKEIPAPISRAELSITSHPSGARVFIDDRPAGQTPVKLSVKAGKTIKLRLQKEGFETVERPLTVPHSRSRALNFELRALPARLVIQSNQWPIEVQINDQQPILLQSAAQPLSLPAGNQRIAFRKTGFKPIVKTLRLQAGEQSALSLNFQPAYGNLELHVLPWANIFIDNALVKKETNIKNQFKLPAGSHKLRIENPAFSVIEKNIRIEADQTLRLHYNFNQKVQTRILAFDEHEQPLFARIFVDGKETGQYTPKAIFLTPGKHRIAVQKKGFLKSEEQAVMILPEQVNTLKFVLKAE